MIFDLTTLLSDAQAITASAASTNVIDLGTPGKVYGASVALTRDVGKGKPIPLLIQVIESFATLTSLTVTMQVDNDEAFGSPKTVWSSGAIPVATLKAGFVIVPEYITRGTDERYMRLYYTVAGSNATTGKIAAGVTMGNQSNG